jgi:FMN phosphatase YigB (HAD superfamily)
MKNNLLVKTIIFDFDGTLYTKDTEIFRESKLGKSIKESYLQLITRFEALSIDEALKIYESAKMENLSQYYAKKYNQTRENIFAQTWGKINVDSVIPKSDVGLLKSELSRISKTTELIGLTAAPRVWALKVLNYLDLTGTFQKMYTAEDFIESKSEIMSLILKNSNLSPDQFLVIGDQFESDIKPAQDLQMQTFLVSNSKQTKDFLNQIF